MSTKIVCSPKRAKQDRDGVYSWVRYHAGFSPRFVRSMISYLKLDSQSEILDPFLGTGTTCLEAKRVGVPSRGIELNGFAFFIARARLGWSFGKEEFEHYLKGVVKGTEGGDDSNVAPIFRRWFAEGDTTPARILSMGEFIKDIPNRDLRDFLVAALTLTARSASRARTGSNPAWSTMGGLKRGPKPDFVRTTLNAQELHAYYIALISSPTLAVVRKKLKLQSLN